MNSLRQATDNVMDVVMFEQWLRFYYTKELDTKDENGSPNLTIDIPEAVLATVRQELPHLVGLAEMVQGHPLTYQSSCDSVCAFVATSMDGGQLPAGAVEKVFDSREYKIEHYLFNLWLSSHEAKLDETPSGYSEWRRMYAEWRATEEVKRYVDNLAATPEKASQSTH